MPAIVRVIRICLPFDGRPWPRDAPRRNGFAGWPPMAGLGIFVELEVVVAGSPDPRSGFVRSAAEIDARVRDYAIDPLAAALAERPSPEPLAVLIRLAQALDEPLDGTLRRITWRLTPFYDVGLETPAMDRLIICEDFDFSAAHRLDRPELGDRESERLYGKCRRIHGHNYRLRVAVRVPVPAPGVPLPLESAELERIVDERILSRLDHRDLTEREEFAGRLTTIEEIARVCHERLAAPIAAAGGELAHVRVWETDRTSCIFPADAPDPF